MKTYEDFEKLGFVVARKPWGAILDRVDPNGVSSIGPTIAIDCPSGVMAYPDGDHEWTPECDDLEFANHVHYSSIEEFWVDAYEEFVRIPACDISINHLIRKCMDLGWYVRASDLKITHPAETPLTYANWEQVLDACVTLASER